MTRLLRLSWLSPAAVEHLLGSTKTGRMDKASVLLASVPVAWSDQMRQMADC
jgi:hypothetical protein